MRSSLGANSYPRNLGGGTEDTFSEVTGITVLGFPQYLSRDNETRSTRSSRWDFLLV